jgi:hypothetical protein
MTGKPWSILKVGAVGQRLGDGEIESIQTHLSQKRFLEAMSHILARLPRVFLLLLKTQDVLRALDVRLELPNRVGIRRALKLGVLCSWRAEHGRIWVSLYRVCLAFARLLVFDLFHF